MTSTYTPATFSPPVDIPILPPDLPHDALNRSIGNLAVISVYLHGAKFRSGFICRLPCLHRGHARQRAARLCRPSTDRAPHERTDPTPDDDAWAIVTSGSTGKPKGVAVTHRNAAAFVDAEARLFITETPLGTGDRVDGRWS